MIRPFVVYTSQHPFSSARRYSHTSEHPKLLSIHTEGQSIKTYNHFFLKKKKSTILQLKRNSLSEKLQSVSEKSL